MFNWFHKRRVFKERAQQLYGSIVAQARSNVFFAEMGVADSVNGRFDMIVIHMFLFLQRLKTEGEQGQELGRHVIEEFFSDMDSSHREMGVGDLSVPKRMRRIGEVFYGLLTVYAEACEAKDRVKLAAIIKRNAYSDSSGGGKLNEQKGADALAGYMLGALEHLAQIPLSELQNGRISFPSAGEGQVQLERQSG